MLEGFPEGRPRRRPGRGLSTPRGTRSSKARGAMGSSTGRRVDARGANHTTGDNMARTPEQKPSAGGEISARGVQQIDRLEKPDKE